MPRRSVAGEAEGEADAGVPVGVADGPPLEATVVGAGVDDGLAVAVEPAPDAEGVDPADEVHHLATAAAPADQEMLL